VKFKQPLHSIPSTGFGEVWALDWINLPNHAGFKHALCFIDKFTKFCHVVPVKDTTTETLARELYALSALHGSPISILSDRGAAHLAPAIKRLCELLKIKRLLTTSYKPSSNGIVENLNKTLIQRLKSELMGQKNWTDMVQTILFALRGTSSTKGSHISPFELVYGHPMRMPGDLLFIKTDAELLGSDTATSVKGRKLLEYLSNLRMRMQLLNQICQENTKIAQENQAKQYDKKAKERSFCVGTKVLMYLSCQTW